MHPENNSNYPDEIRANEAKRALYDYFGGNTDEALSMDRAIKASLSTNCKDNYQKQKQIKHAIYDNLLQYGYDKDKIYKEVDDIFSIMERQKEYDQ